VCLCKEYISCKTFRKIIQNIFFHITSTIVSNLYQLETKQLIVTAEMLALGV